MKALSIEPCSRALEREFRAISFRDPKVVNSGLQIRVNGCLRFDYATIGADIFVIVAGHGGGRACAARERRCGDLGYERRAIAKRSRVQHKRVRTRSERDAAFRL